MLAIVKPETAVRWHRKPPPQSWRTFLDNHVGDLVSIDFFTVPTATCRILLVFVVLTQGRRRVLHAENGPRLMPFLDRGESFWEWTAAIQKIASDEKYGRDK